MKYQSKLLVSLTLGAFALAIASCSDTVDEITDSIDCHQVCKRYADCGFQPGYDVDGCTDRCENTADSNSERERKLRLCDACIDDRSCAAAAFKCADDCLGIVP